MALKIKIVVSYDGTDFLGWQVQPHPQTVAGVLERVYARVFGEKISILGASRTDAGVHALGQVAMFKTELHMPTDRMMHAWNASLPRSIVIRSLERAAEDFHPFHGVVAKTYYYHIFMSRPLPFVARFGWCYPYAKDLNLVVLSKALQLFVGTHDFGSFCTVDADAPQETVRTVHSVSLRNLKWFGVLQIAVTGKSFVRFQIRRMVGAALEASRREDLGVDEIARMLSSPNPAKSLPKAPAEGLCLRKIVYE